MTNPLGGADIAQIMSSKGPVVQCVILRCQRLDNDGSGDTVDSSSPEADANATTRSRTETEESKPAATIIDKEGAEQDPNPTRVVLTDWIDQIEIDTTPSKSMVAKTLGGPFTFLGQYQDEGVVLMVRKLPDDLELHIMERDEEDDDGDGNDDNDNRGKIGTTKELKEQLSRNFKVSELKELCHEREIPTDTMLEKADVIEALIQYQGALPPYNPHRLQPPLHNVRVRGDILILRVAETEEEFDDEEGDDDEKKAAGDDDDVDDGEQPQVDDGDGDDDDDVEADDKKDEDDKDEDNDASGTDDHKDELYADDAKETSVLSNEEFFLDYTKNEYIAFASRTDIPEHEPQHDEEDDEEDDDEGGPVGIIREDGEEVEEEEKSAVFNLVMNEVLRQYREENGRGPNTQELLELRANIAKELDFQVADVMDGDWDKKAKRKESPSGKNIAFHEHDMVKEYEPDRNEYAIDADPYGTMPGNDDEDDDDDDDDAEPAAKRVKSSHEEEEEEEEEEDSKPARVNGI